MPDALPCIASLVKISNKLQHISSGYVKKTTQKQPKIVLSAGMKTFKISKLGNSKSNINKTWPRYVPPEHHYYTKKMRVSINGPVEVQPKNAVKLRESQL